MIIENEADPRIFTFGNTAVMLVGCVVLGAVYPYLILKTGFVSGITMVSALMTVFMFKAVLRRQRIDARETNVVQTAMTTAANVGFMSVVLAALDMLGIPMSPILAFFWLLVSASLGTLMAIPFRRQLIDVEQLSYPHGKAIGEMLMDLEDSSGPAATKTRALSFAGLAAVLFVWARDVLRWIPLPFTNNYEMGFEPSLMLMALGALIDVRTALWMLAGSAVMWGVAAPWMLAHGIAQETAQAFALQGALARGAYYTVLMRWTMWPATIILLTHGLTSIGINWRSLADSLRSLVATAKGGGAHQPDAPFKPVVGGIIVLTAILCVVQFLGFGIRPWVTVAAVVVSFPLMLVGLRVKGETGIGPISDMASLAQLFFGALLPGNMGSIMASSGSTASVAIASESIMDDMKAAKKVGNRPQSLTFAQLVVGIPMGALMTSLVYPLLKSMYGFGEHGLAAPTARKWQGLALLLSKGWHILPKSVFAALAVAAAVGVVLALMETRWRRWTPSAMGLGTALLLPASTVLPIAAGSILAWLFGRLRPEKRALYLVPVAAGLLSGEAVTSLVVSFLRILGLIK